MIERETWNIFRPGGCCKLESTTPDILRPE